MAVEYTLDPEDIASARLLAIGIRPRLEFALFAATIAGELGLSVSPWSFGSLPLLIGLTASLGAFRLMQISKVKGAAAAAFRRNETLRRVTVASWDADGISIQPTASVCERILWAELQPLKENDRRDSVSAKGRPHSRRSKTRLPGQGRACRSPQSGARRRLRVRFEELSAPELRRIPCRTDRIF